MTPNKRLEQYAKAIKGQIVAHGVDKETLKIPILIVRKKRNFYIEIIELRLEKDNHILVKLLSEVYVG